ncbi:hypothetical protein D9757_009604 [Collybiopsis confluens]|uniref:RING-type domain-containing protein n=1 Tax=Collybiopsis confluens TaxID=2823264 RepID=A0A8H5H4L8_9AGAR|nr:hypothetical protein D9757_009604 [Collybiopsis confluens]
MNDQLTSNNIAELGEEGVVEEGEVAVAVVVQAEVETGEETQFNDVEPVATLAATTTGAEADAGESEELDVCWICAEPVKYYSLSACNHRTCHVCGLRLRALYKKDDCTFYKEPQSEVVFTLSPDKPFSEYTIASSPSIDNTQPRFYDAKLRITFESQEMMTESLILL